MSHNLTKIAITILFAAILWSCRHEYDPKLLEIDRIILSNNDVGPNVLDEVDYSELSSENKALYNLLKIKASDLAYIEHKNDSLIKVVLDYYSSHKDDRYYPEALYYGGRVYSDLHDFPTALQYFHKALDLVPADTDNKLLRNKVLSQTARLLATIGATEQAIVLLEDATVSELAEGDSVRLAHDLRLLGFAYLNSRKYAEADSIFTESEKVSVKVCPEMLPYVQMYHANCKHGLGEFNEAVRLINGVPDKITDLITDRNTADAIAIDIYHAAGLPDSAYKYAIRLANSPSNHNKPQAYHHLLTPELKHLVPHDSAVKYVQGFYELLQSNVRAQNDNVILTQNANYNYNLHDRDREKAEAKSRRWQWMVCIGAFVLLTTVIVFLIISNRNKTQIIKLTEALDAVNRKNSGEQSAAPAPPTAHDLRERLRTEITRQSSETGLRNTPDEITSSQAYTEITQLALRSQPIPNGSALWSELEQAVRLASPQFISNINLLMDSKPKHHEMQTILLIKAGFTQANIARLCGRSSSTISERIARIGLTLTGRQLTTDEAADFIRSI